MATKKAPDIVAYPLGAEVSPDQVCWPREVGARLWLVLFRGTAPRCARPGSQHPYGARGLRFQSTGVWGPPGDRHAGPFPTFPHLDARAGVISMGPIHSRETVGSKV